MLKSPSPKNKEIRKSKKIINSKESSLSVHIGPGKERSLPIVEFKDRVALGMPIKYRLKWEPKDIDEQNELACEFVEWGYRSESLDCDEFPLFKGINPYRFYKIAQTNELFADALLTVRCLIAYRLKKACRARDISESYLFGMLPLYDMEYKQMKMDAVMRVIQARMGNQYENFKIVEMQPIPNSDLVKDKE